MGTCCPYMARVLDLWYSFHSIFTIYIKVCMEIGNVLNILGIGVEIGLKFKIPVKNLTLFAPVWHVMVFRAENTWYFISACQVSEEQEKFWIQNQVGVELVTHPVKINFLLKTKTAPVIMVKLRPSISNSSIHNLHHIIYT